MSARNHRTSPSGVRGETPPVLVDQPMVERADEDEVLEIGRAALRPPDDVVRLGEAARPAAREDTSAITVSELPQHPRRGLAAESTDPDHLAASVLEHGLHARVAHETFDDGRREGGPLLGLAAVRALDEPVEPGVNHDRRGSKLALGAPARPAERDERVGTSGVGVAVLAGHRRDAFHHPFDRCAHGLAVGGRELGVHLEPVVFVPPGERARAIGHRCLERVAASLDVCPVPDRAGGHASRPPHESVLVVEVRESGQLGHLVDREETGGEGVGDRRERLELVCRPDPSLGFPKRDPVAHLDPVRAVPRAVGFPSGGPIDRDERREEVAVCTPEGDVCRVGSLAMVGVEHACDATGRASENP